MFVCVYGYVCTTLQVTRKRKITKNGQEKGRLNIARRQGVVVSNGS